MNFQLINPNKIKSNIDDNNKYLQNDELYNKSISIDEVLYKVC